jgi:hypothetical protein
VRTPALGALFYLIPFLGAAIALAVLAGINPPAWLRRPKPVEALS